MISEGRSAGTPDKVATAIGKDYSKRRYIARALSMLGRDPTKFDYKRIPTCVSDVWSRVPYHWKYDVEPFHEYEAAGEVDTYLRGWPPSGSINETILRYMFDSQMEAWQRSTWDPWRDK